MVRVSVGVSAVEPGVVVVVVVLVSEVEGAVGVAALGAPLTRRRSFRAGELASRVRRVAVSGCGGCAGRLLRLATRKLNVCSRLGMYRV
jgi:hypothetical protein